MNATKWVLIDNTKGAPTQDGAKLSPHVLAHIAEAVEAQLQGEFTAEWGGRTQLRVGKGLDDIEPGEWAYVFLPALPDAPDSSAYHDIKKGVPYALCAVKTCGSLYGADGVSVDASHEIIEAAGDPGANQFANDNRGFLHAVELCDAVEMHTYPKTCKDGTVVQVSNWLLRSWFNPGAAGPYDYMTAAKLSGAVSPPGPLKTAPGHGGNYQIIAKWGGDKQIFAAAQHIDGTRRKGASHWSSRTGRRLAQIAHRDDAIRE